MQTKQDQKETQVAPRWLTMILVKGFGFKRLRGANLRGANLHRANLTGANLHNAILSNTDLTGAIGADLSGTILE